MTHTIRNMNGKFFAWLKRERLGLGLLGGAWAVFFGHVFLAGNVFFLDDLKIIYYPLEHAYAQAQANWELPLWNNEFGFGHPLLAWGQLGFFTPLHMLLRVFSIHPLVLLQISIAGYFLAGLVGWYVFLRKRMFEQLSAALAASIFVLGGFSIAHLNHVNFYTGTMLLPYLLLAGLAVLKKQTARRTALLALAAAAIALSSQPQVTLFCFLAAAGLLLCIAFEPQYRPAWRRVSISVIIAAVLGGGLATLTLLPLMEFLPETERATPLPRPELLEFSYPPWHAVTLVLPYFYGDHGTYWGAKGFQELAAFTGLIPLFLAGGALTTWKRYRSERITGIVFIILALAFALGRHSPVYAYLIEEQFITSLGVAGRFVFFFDVGITLLAACGLSDLIRAAHSRIPPLFTAGGIGLSILLFTPFLIRVLQASPERRQLRVLLQANDGFVWLVLITAILIIALITFRWQYRAHALTAAAIATLVIYAWDYNPPTPTKTAFAQSALSQELQAYNAAGSTAPRLYSRPTLIQSHTNESEDIRYSDPISPEFSVFQPLFITESFNCITIPLEAPEGAAAAIAVGLHANPLSKPLEQITIPGYEIGRGTTQRACFTGANVTPNSTIWISLTSGERSGAVVAFAPQTNPEFQVHFVRVQNPNSAQWEQSRKPLQTGIAPEYISAYDEEAAARARHMNVLDNTSSARWIGALSIREYRAFIEFFFANDASPFDGDGVHVIEKYRSILNMAGITHLAQLISPGSIDHMESHKFELTSAQDLGGQELRIYKNSEAYPKAFLVPGAIWIAAADETRHAISMPSFDPRAVVYLSGPKPPNRIIEPGLVMPPHTATITQYTSSRVDVTVDSSQDAYLVLTDSTTPQWQTYIDEQPAAQLVGNSIFKAAFVPAGHHTVSFRYESPATEQATVIASLAFAVSLGTLMYPARKRLLRQ